MSLVGPGGTAATAGARVILQFSRRRKTFLRLSSSNTKKHWFFDRAVHVFLCIMWYSSR